MDVRIVPPVRKTVAPQKQLSSLKYLDLSFVNHSCGVVLH